VQRPLQQMAYLTCLKAMQDHSQIRGSHTADEFWLIEHSAVFTQGQAGKPEHLLSSTDIPLVQSDRGGQVTYHGPGQLLVYTLLDLKRLGLNIRQLVSALQNAVIALLKDYGIHATSRDDAPGVYVDKAKICSLGLRVRRGCCYHGLSLNIDMDLQPFSKINPCGYQNLKVTQLKDLGINLNLARVAQDLMPHLLETLGYTRHN
jgi:lipoyl(octanoyl) transferase